ncbi:TPA: hypothetical protein I8271_004571 [Kluyvera intermedia]|uniref:Uncharacterized protein n=1 Tax=Kluyvera intermedia TaxID=61648 RepID=A0A9P3TB14_KLUIN|nr:hypothetical protein [Phytobacter ursingii]HAT2206959.1 hypothetical protein [Kluyvera intermedia]HAT2517682.1 hypothetical protein [Kluyvera intermedia]HAT2605754.1 hypothetical protein [Kluyvera intermedia]HAT2682659.1 hypothetical protein [Kluyvera intermedia]HAT2699141.1 hypothetical protein [Kluyvera intermedia]
MFYAKAHVVVGNVRVLNERKNWPMVIANSPGIVPGLLTFSIGLLPLT